jgi:hypothetical protein
MDNKDKLCSYWIIDNVLMNGTRLATPYSHGVVTEQLHSRSAQVSY